MTRTPTRRLLAQDAARYFAAWNCKPGFGTWLRLCFLTPGFQLGLSIRLQAVVGRVPVIGKGLRRVFWYAATIWFGCDIDPQAEFAGGLFLPHPLGIVVGGEVRVGRNVAILHGVTLGRRGESGDGLLLIGDDVEVGAGAKVLGAFGVGAGARIGANAVVLKAVPAGMTAVGIPARNLSPQRFRPGKQA